MICIKKLQKLIWYNITLIWNYLHVCLLCRLFPFRFVERHCFPRDFSIDLSGLNPLSHGIWVFVSRIHDFDYIFIYMKCVYIYTHTHDHKILILCSIQFHSTDLVHCQMNVRVAAAYYYLFICFEEIQKPTEYTRN